MSCKGCEVPRIFTPPLRELTPETTLGYDVIDFATNVLGMSLNPWQRWLFIHALEIEGDLDDVWWFRYAVVVVLVGRQQGKTLMSVVLALFFMYILCAALILGTAQDLEQAEDTWAECVEMAQENEELAEEIKHVWFTNGAKRLSLYGGRDYRVKASTRKAGRGKSADLVILDELREQRNFEAWDALSPTTLARERSLIWCISNAGDASSVVLRHLRMKAHAALGDPDHIVEALEGKADAPDEEAGEISIGIFEWSAPPDADIRDRDAWAQAMPSLGYTVTERAVAGALAKTTVDGFKTEYLCQWVTSAINPPFPHGSWDAGRDEDSVIAPDAQVTFGVDVSADRRRAAICACGMRSDRSYHVELIAYQTGQEWLVGWFRDVAAGQKVRVALQGRGAPVSALADVLDAIDGVEVIKCEGKELAAYCGRTWDGVASNTEKDLNAPAIHHRTQAALDLAAALATTRPMGDGGYVWDRHKSSEDISPLVAMTMAYGLATRVEEKPKESAYSHGRELMVL